MVVDFFIKYFGYIVFPLIGIANILYLLSQSKKRRLQRNKLLEDNYKAIYKCKIIKGGKSKLRAIMASDQGVKAEIVLYDNKIQFITAFEDIQPEIQIKDIVEIYMTELLLKRVLYIKQSIPSSVSIKYDDLLKEFFLYGSKEDLLMIKEFIKTHK